MENVVEMKFKN